MSSDSACSSILAQWWKICIILFLFGWDKIRTTSKSFFFRVNKRFAKITLWAPKRWCQIGFYHILYLSALVIGSQVIRFRIGAGGLRTCSKVYTLLPFFSLLSRSRPPLISTRPTKHAQSVSWLMLPFLPHCLVCSKALTRYPCIEWR